MSEVGSQKSEESNLKLYKLRLSPLAKPAQSEAKCPSPLLKVKINNFKQTLRY